MSKQTLSLLNPKTVNYSDSGSGGVPKITWEDVCKVLSKLPSHISSYARLKYNGEFNGTGYNSNFGEALDGLRAIGGLSGITEQMPADKWLKMTELVLFDGVKDGNRCPLCNGTGSSITKGSYANCEKCKGTGKLSLTINAKAEYIGYSDGRSYERYGDRHYCKLMKEIHGWDREVTRQCGKIHL